MPSVADVVRLQKEAVDAADEAMLREMAKSWMDVEKALKDKVDLLSDDIYNLARSGKPVSQGMLYKRDRLQNLMLQAQEEVAKYSGQMATFVAGKQAESVALGVQHAGTALEAAMGGQFDRLSTMAVEAMIATTSGMAADGGPLRQLLFERMKEGLDTDVLDSMMGTMRSAVAQGWNPKKTAKLLKNDLAGGLDKALLIARTETMRAYRLASSEQYKVAGVEQVMRMCAHTSKTCAACIADEGQLYPADEPLPDHPRGRCVPVPVPPGTEPPKWVRGEEWLAKQPEATQRTILGKKRYDLWKEGTPLTDFAHVTDNVTWGQGLGVTPLKDIGQVRS